MKTPTLLIIILLLIFFGCDEASKKQVKEVIKEDNKEMTINEIDSVISSGELRKALLEFIFKADTIPNPFGRTVRYIMSFYKKDADTLLSLTAAIDFLIILPENRSYYELKGVFSVSDKDIALYDFKESLGGSCYYQNKLKVKEIPYQNDSLYIAFSESHEGWTYVPPFILYKIKKGELIKIDSYFGKESL